MSATAQVPLFSDDFATPDLDGWASGLAGCDVTTGVWSVQDQVLVFEQETCDDCPTPRGSPTVFGRIFQ